MIDVSNPNLANYVKRFEQVIHRTLQTDTSRRMQNKFRLVGGDFLSEKKRPCRRTSTFLTVVVRNIFFY